MKTITKIIIVNLILLIIVLTVLFPLPKTPKNNEVIFDRKPEFRWIGIPMTYTILIDNNPEFTSPIKKQVYCCEYIPEENLPFENLYWKVKGVFPSIITQFRIESEIALKLKQEQENYTVTNDGNSKLNVSIEQSSKNKISVTGQAILDLDESLTLNKNTRVKAEQYE
ncbi:MAG: hypothetical protein PHE43_04355 [Candidatus Nanoarchaeia archaeon]|nr:hypothetical protein [Candidatus Nanoarchaeia archaeon]